MVVSSLPFAAPVVRRPNTRVVRSAPQEQPDVYRSATSGVLGASNSVVSIVLLKLTALGVPDIYQGPELWNFSLVDPDNRRTLDFAVRRTHPAGGQSVKSPPGGQEKSPPVG